jgi:hypothetical protein
MTSEDVKPSVVENKQKMENLKDQITTLLVQYKAEKEQARVLKESIERVKTLRSEMHDKKVANKKIVEELKKELEELKAKQNRVARDPNVSAIPEDEVAEIEASPAPAPQDLAKMKILDDLKKELDRLKAQVRDATSLEDENKK